MQQEIKSAQDVKNTIDEIMNHVGFVVVGQEEVLKQVVTSVLCGSNALLEGYPGLAKTLVVITFVKFLD